MDKDKLMAEKAKEIVLNKPTKCSKSAIIFAFILFVITFMLYFAINTVMPAQKNEITDWKFISGKSASDIEGELTSYNLANAQNRIYKKWKTPYIRMQYVVKSSDVDSRFILKTDYNPVSIRLNNEEVLNTGYGENDFSGSCYNEVILPAGNEKTLDVYLYSPMAFHLSTYIETKSISVAESFTKYLGFGFGIAFFVIGAGLFLFTIFLSPLSKHTTRMLSLAATIMFAGMGTILYSFTQTTNFLASPFWFGVIHALQFLLIMLSYVTLMSCSKKAIKKARVFIPIALLSGILIAFPKIWSMLLVSTIFTLALIYVSVKAYSLLSHEMIPDVPKLGAVKGIFLYLALCQLFNTISLVLGLSVISGYVFFCSTFLMCVSIFVVYCNQIIYLDIINQEHTKQLDLDGAWIQDIAEFLSKMFMQTDESAFLTLAAKSLSKIIEKNAYSDASGLQVYACAAIKQGVPFKEVYNDTNIKNCNYDMIYNYLISSDSKILIGNKSVDMLFISDTNAAVIHFENISCGVTSSLENIIKSAFLNLSVAYKNIKIKNDMTSMQEELFINLAIVVEERDKATQQHQVVVSILTYEMCLQLGMSVQRAKLISKASLTHDIGKIAVTERILNKKGKLTDEEYAEMKKHAIFGYNILSVQKGEFFDEAAKIAKQHHENFDGSGYYGIGGKDIAPSARIVHLIDVVDALLSKRSYKEAWGREEAVNYIVSKRGTMFDPAVVDAFLNCSDNLFKIRERILMEETN